LLARTDRLRAPVWCHSANTRIIDPAINDALRILTGSLRPIPKGKLPILAGTQPAEFRRNGATKSPKRRVVVPRHLLHSGLACPPDTDARRLKSRHPFVTAAQHLISLSDNNNICAANWTDHQWNADWVSQSYKTPCFHPRHRDPTAGYDLFKNSVGKLLTTFAPVSDVSTLACTVGVWLPPRFVSTAQKNKLPTRLSSNVQSIDFHMDSTTRTWTMRQSND